MDGGEEDVADAAYGGEDDDGEAALLSAVCNVGGQDGDDEGDEEGGGCQALRVDGVKAHVLEDGGEEN